MENTFISYPVGQGFFYSGTIYNDSSEPFQLVYDCGSNNMSVLNECISYYKKEFHIDFDKKAKIKIDMLVVSHFDADHVNGLIKLLEKTEVEQMYIPYYNNPAILYLVNYIIESAQSANVKKIVLVRGDNEDRNIEQRELEEQELILLDDREFPEDLKDRLYTGKDSFEIPQIKWEFYLFNVIGDENIKFTDRINKFEKMIEERMKKEKVKKVSELIQKIERKEIKKIYEIAFTDESENEKIPITKNDWSNNSSVCLYHQPSDTSKIITEKLSFTPVEVSLLAVLLDDRCNFKIEKSIKTEKGTLLTGDINLAGERIEEFKNWIENKKLDINMGVIYLPHHGSWRNWNEYLQIEKYKNAIFISSAGKDNPYNHPSPALIMALKRKNRIHIPCNEDNYFGYSLQ